MSEPCNNCSPITIQNPRATIGAVTDLSVNLDTEDELDLETEDGEPLVVV